MACASSSRSRWLAAVFVVSIHGCAAYRPPVLRPPRLAQLRVRAAAVAVPKHPKTNSVGLLRRVRGSSATARAVFIPAFAVAVVAFQSFTYLCVETGHFLAALGAATNVGDSMIVQQTPDVLGIIFSVFASNTFTGLYEQQELAHVAVYAEVSVLRVDGALLASTIPAQYPLMEPVVGYGWSRDTNCFPANSTRRGFREGARRHAPVVGAYNASNLLEFQYVTGLTVAGNAVGDPLHLKDSPFWTLTPSYGVRVRDLRITAPIRTPGIGNTDGVENVVNNSDDGVCMKSGLDGFGINLAIPTEDVLARGCVAPDPGPPLPAMSFSCKRVARTLFGEITLPWPVCVPREAPVNVYRDYPNWGPARVAYPSLGACKAACH
ncbi:glycosyl hydrolase [Aureococcus anophagefferens]|nr:glycosyl hydrolase [Aureococcus anophagefferens]